MSGARTALVKVDMSKGWMKSNPELAGKSLLDFVEQHPPEEWTLTIHRANFPGMFISLCAKPKGSNIDEAGTE